MRGRLGGGAGVHVGSQCGVSPAFLRKEAGGGASGWVKPLSRSRCLRLRTVAELPGQGRKVGKWVILAVYS